MNTIEILNMLNITPENVYNSSGVISRLMKDVPLKSVSEIINDSKLTDKQKVEQIKLLEKAESVKLSISLVYIITEPDNSYSNDEVGVILFDGKNFIKGMGKYSSYEGYNSWQEWEYFIPKEKIKISQ